MGHRSNTGRPHPAQVLSSASRMDAGHS
jgi:hypothetical protein